MANEPIALTGTWHISRNLEINLYVLYVLCFLSLVIAVAAVSVRLATDNRFIIRRIWTAGGTLLVLNPSIAGSALIGIHNIVAIVASAFLHIYFSKSRFANVATSLAVLLPMPLFLWSWFSAFGIVYAFALSANMSGRGRFAQYRSLLLNLICYIPPILLCVLAGIYTRRWRDQTTDVNFLTLQLSQTTDDATISTLLAQKATASASAERQYKAIWTMWTVGYGLSWIIYFAYSFHLLRILGNQLNQKVANGKSVPHQASVSSEEEKNSPTSPISPTSIFSTSRQPQVFRTDPSIALLRRNIILIGAELVAFSLFDVAWCTLALVKAIMGYKVLKNPVIGFATVLIELYLCIVFGGLAAITQLLRGIGQLRNQRLQHLESNKTAVLERRTTPPPAVLKNELQRPSDASGAPLVEAPSSTGESEASHDARIVRIVSGQGNERPSRLSSDQTVLETQELFPFISGGLAVQLQAPGGVGDGLRRPSVLRRPSMFNLE